jgi:hypothetical protein
MRSGLPGLLAFLGASACAVRSRRRGDVGSSSGLHEECERVIERSCGAALVGIDDETLEERLVHQPPDAWRGLPVGLSQRLGEFQGPFEGLLGLEVLDVCRGEALFDPLELVADPVLFSLE